LLSLKEDSYCMLCNDGGGKCTHSRASTRSLRY
jgi:hypothetical protein